MGNLANLMQQAQKMQKDLARLQNDLKERMVEGSAADGAISVIASGDGKVASVRLQPEVVDPDDVESLEDLLIVAVNNALEKAEELKKTESEKITGGMNLPGMF